MLFLSRFTTWKSSIWNANTNTKAKRYCQLEGCLNWHFSRHRGDRRAVCPTAQIWGNTVEQAFSCHPATWSLWYRSSFFLLPCPKLLSSKMFSLKSDERQLYCLSFDFSVYLGIKIEEKSKGDIRIFFFLPIWCTEAFPWTASDIRETQLCWVSDFRKTEFATQLLSVCFLLFSENYQRIYPS